MDPRFAAYNTHHYNPEQYWDNDVHLRQLKSQPYQYEHPLIKELPKDIPGIYTISGGRQIGKTTLLKQWIASLIIQGTAPTSIFFFTGELIDNHHALVSLLQDLVDEKKKDERLFIIIDEVTYIKDWDKGIKFAADAGYLSNCVVILTGSDLNLMQAARMTFPGRRGKADKVDFHIYSLSFKTFLQLKQTIPIDELSKGKSATDQKIMQQLYQEFQEYLKHGGYLTAINDIARDGRILSATLKTYSD